MCGTPDIPEPTRLQESKAPVFNTLATQRSKAGRRGTILTQSPVATAAAAMAPTGGKTLLGQ